MKIENWCGHDIRFVEHGARCGKKITNVIRRS